MIKILSLGNSFSQDAHKWLFPIAAAGHVDMVCANLCIGGCPLEKHHSLLHSDEPSHYLEVNGTGVRMVTIREAVESEAWDVITFQQVSQLSGQYETYQPYLDELVAYVRECCPQAKLYFHETWAYDVDSDHFGLAFYENSQRVMYEALYEATRKAADAIGATLIPAGDVIQYLRENAPEFDYPNGGLSLCRDSFHMSLDYGRYAVAATWFATILGGDIGPNSFRPPMVEGEVDEACIAAIKNAVKHICG